MSTRLGKESLADVLRRRSTVPPEAHHGRAAAMQHTLGTLTRGADGATVDVPLDELHPNPFQPRFQLNREPLEQLAQSLASEGQLEPAIARRVRRAGREVLELVAGARRLEAARLCHRTIKPFPTLRVEIRDLSDEEAERVALIENLQRENLTPLEEGYRYWQLQQRDPRRWSVRAIADFVHKKKSSVQNRLGLIKDAGVAEAVLREQIPPTAGFHILRLPAAERQAYLRQAADARLTVEQVKAEVDRRLAPRREAVASGRAARAPEGARAGAPSARDASHRAALEAQRTQLLERIEALERELHQRQAALRAVERELSTLGQAWQESM